MRLLERYRDSRQVRQIEESLSAAPAARLQLSGTVGSQECFVLTGSYLHHPRHHLFIAGDKEEAAYIQNTLGSLFDTKPVHFFPDSFKRPLFFEELNTTNVLQRTEIINKISADLKGESGILIVTYPEALFEKVVAPRVLEESRIEIKKGEKLDADFLIEMLVEYGFVREEFVFEPGQFSIRGGIVDVYSYGNDYPYRVELFDDEVESIRTFDPGTQLSQQNIARVNIVPNINTKFSHAQKVPLGHVLPKNTVVWLKDLQATVDKLQICFEKAFEFSKTISALDESELAEIFRDRAFIRPDEIVEDLQNFPLIFLSNPKIVSADGSVIDLSKNGEQEISRVQFNAKPQPSFN